MKLTEHFSIEEFERSGYAQEHQLDNKVPRELIPSLCNLCAKVLEPLRKHAGKPVIISSGYRSPELNQAVGGVVTSQHLKGEAADIHLNSLTEGREWFKWIQTHCTFDQLIWDSDKTGAHWIHVSCRIVVSANRMQVL